MGDCACDVRLRYWTCETLLSHLYLELTPICNSHCPGCGSASLLQGGVSSLSKHAWQPIVDQLLRLNIHLRITGGEPTLHPDFEDILAYIDARGMPFTLFTNGRWTDPPRTVAFLRSLKHLECLLISVHGAGPPSHEAFTATPGSLEETLANVQLATEARLRVTSSTVITHQNHNELPELFALARSVGIQRHTLSRYIGLPLPGIEASESELAQAVHSVEKMRSNGSGPRDGVDTVHYGGPIPRCFANNSSNGCMAGFAHAAVDCWGNLKPCTHVSITAGNLLEEDFDTLWHSPTMEAWRAAYLAQCDGCPLAGECRSGCPAQAIWRGHEKDPLVTWRRPDCGAPGQTATSNLDGIIAGPVHRLAALYGSQQPVA